MPAPFDRAPHKISLHGGHSGQFCDHAVGTLRETVEAAIAFGYHTFGISEHAPRSEERFLYSEERRRGWSVETLAEMFDAYAQEVHLLAREYADRIVILRGFEAEVIPDDSYRHEMQALRAAYDWDFVVGSVHYVREIQIDGHREEYQRAIDACGGLEAFVVEYYDAVASMATALRPEVIGHLDLVRRFAENDTPLDTPAMARAANGALEAIRDVGAVLDVNTAGIRKGLGSPYPAPWLVARAKDVGVGLCFGVDSHGPEQVGEGLEEAREYLRQLGVDALTGWTRRDGERVRESFSLA